jgi:ABC-type transport system involved in multi-copper enzyme maturation permease subunit
LLLVGFVAFYVEGFKNSTNLVAGPDKGKLFVAGTLPQIANTISVAGALIGLLLLAHEYRYNTIVYTLTISNSRSKVLASKIIAVLTFVTIYSLFATAMSLSLIWAGAAISGHSIPYQDINYLIYLAKSVFNSIGFGMVGLLFITLIRNQVGAIAAIFILPNTVEGLLSLLLKHNSVYMPFTALQQVVQAPVLSGARSVSREATTGNLAPPKGALVFGVYLVLGWIVAWYLFLRRDAS